MFKLEYCNNFVHEKMPHVTREDNVKVVTELPCLLGHPVQKFLHYLVFAHNIIFRNFSAGAINDFTISKYLTLTPLIKSRSLTNGNRRIPLTNGALKEQSNMSIL